MFGGLDAGAEDIVGEEPDDRDDETGGGGDEGFADTAGDRAGGGADVAVTEGAERGHHAGDRAEEAEERGGGDAGVENGETLLEAGEFAVGGAHEGVGQRVFAVGEGVNENTGDVVGAFLAQGDGGGGIAGFDVFEHLFDDLGLAGGVFADEENRALDHDGDGEEGDHQNGPHDRAPVGEKLHRAEAHEKCEMRSGENHKTKG